jgi:hypothetical protein
MTLPKFILGDNTQYPEAIFVIHTEFPRFIINLENDEIEWLEDFDQNEKEQLLEETQLVLKQAYNFYDSEIEKYQS